MKTQRIIVLGLCLTTATAGLAQASEGERGPHRGGRGRGGHPVVRVLDADKNREISAAELANSATALRTLDANNDGTISMDELRPARPADAPASSDAPRDGRGGDRQRPADPVMLALDANSDRALSAAEIANAPTSLVALDANKDGKLTHDELRPVPSK